jgi:hypothetical protein
LKDRRVRTLLGVSHIPYMAKNLISVGKMADASVHVVFENHRVKMVQGEMVLMRGVQCGTLYKILGSTITNGCNGTIVLEGKNEEVKALANSKDNH